MPRGHNQLDPASRWVYPAGIPLKNKERPRAKAAWFIITLITKSQISNPMKAWIKDAEVRRRIPKACQLPSRFENFLRASPPFVVRWTNLDGYCLKRTAANEAVPFLSLPDGGLVAFWFHDASCCRHTCTLAAPRRAYESTCPQFRRVSQGVSAAQVLWFAGLR